MQALAFSLQGVTPQYGAANAEASEGEQMAHQLQQLDALDSELAAFERRFASADPEVKQMLAQMLLQDMSNPDTVLQGNVTPAEQCFPVATPTSSDSAQTFPCAGGEHVQHHAAISCSSVGGDYGGSARAVMPVTSALGGHQSSSACPPSGTWQAAVHAQGRIAPDDSMPIDGNSTAVAQTVGGDGASAAMFPAVTPANSLAQQAVQRDTLSDCAASLPMPASNPPVRSSLSVPFDSASCHATNLCKPSRWNVHTHQRRRRFQSLRGLRNILR